MGNAVSLGTLFDQKYRPAFSRIVKEAIESEDHDLIMDL